jgi:cyclophilin family peptidyl-prolyl cis-trans isomerase
VLCTKIDHPDCVSLKILDMEALTGMVCLPAFEYRLSCAYLRSLWPYLSPALQSPHLDGKHTVFGRVTESTLGVLDDMQLVKTKHDKPLKEVKM